MPDKTLECAELLRSLADRDRLRIIRALGSGEKNVGELAEELQIEIANASHHLGILRHAGILLREKRGRFVVYQIHPKIRKLAKANAKDTAEQLDLGCCRLEWPEK